MSSKEKENVICPVCSSFEPQTWRKNLCKNCFHEIDEHNNEGDVKDTDNKKTDASPDKNKTGTDKEKRKSIIDEIDQKKPATDVKDKSNTKKATPEVPAKTSSSSKTNQNTSQKAKENVDQKQKSFSVPSSKLQAGKSDPKQSEDKIPDKTQTIGQKGKENADQKQKITSKSPGKLDLTKSSFDKMSQSTSNVTSRDDAKKQTTPDKNTPSTPREIGDTKLGQKFETDKKPSSANIIPKSKTNDSKPASQDNKSIVNKIQNRADDKDAKKSITSDRDSKSKQEDKSSKVKKFAKSFSFSAGEDADDVRFNSLGRKKVKDKSPSPQTPPLSSAESKTGIKPQFPTKDENVSQKAAVGGNVDKAITGSSGVNKNISDLPQKKNVDLTKSKDSGNEKDINKSTSGLFGKDKSEKEKGKDTGSEKIGRNIDKLFNKADGNKNVWKLPSKSGSPKEEYDKSKRNSLSDVELSEDATKIDQELEKLKAQLAQMEKKCSTLEDENQKLKHGLTEKERQERQLKIQKSDVENSIKSLQNQLSSMESRCSKLDTDNTNLIDKLKQQQVNQEKMADKVSSEEMKKMEEEVQESEDICEELQGENETLKQEIAELKSEMDEMYDNFREQEAEEFRELQRDLEVTSKNCRILQFKLRKAERKSEQVEKDRDHYEEKLKMLQSSFNSEDARSHIESLEEELRMAKEVSVRLHDQLDVLEDKGSKMDEENQHLTRLLELSDKKQFRMEMEIDKLRDQVMDMRDKMKDRSQPTTPGDEITDRKGTGDIGNRSFCEENDRCSRTVL